MTLSYLQVVSIVLIIGLSPFILFYFYRLFPQTTVWENSLFTLTSNGFKTVHAFIWTASQKFIPVVLLSLWYVTCKYNWYHVIVLPLSLYILQFVNIVFFKDEVDILEIYFVIPIAIATWLTLFKIRKLTIRNLKLLELGKQLLKTKNDLNNK
jgi:hypothetical protein